MSAAPSLASRRSSRTRLAPPSTTASIDPTLPAASSPSQEQQPLISGSTRRSSSSSSLIGTRTTASQALQGQDSAAARRKRSREIEQGTHDQMDEDLPAERDTKRAGLQPYSTTASTSRPTLASPETLTPSRPLPSLLACTPTTPSTPLPSLLSHLSLSPSFPASPTPISALGTFSFPSPAPPPPPSPTLAARQPPHHPTYLYRGYIRPLSEMDLKDKRPSSGPHPHLFKRTKKRKLVHRFFRCEAILSGPSTPSSSSPLSSPNTSPPSARVRPRSASMTYSPTHPRRSPSWWPSVSRNAGDGMVSRMGPLEAEWVGDGSGWLTRLRINFSGSGAAVARLEKALQDDRDKGKEREVEGGGVGVGEHLGALLGASAMGGRPVMALAPAMGRAVSKRSRAVSSPPAFNREKVETGAGGGPWAPPPLKQHLLAVLRMRLSEGGGTSKGGEAGLKFKKWVVWNSWMRRTSGLAEDEDEDDLVEGNGSDSEEDMDGEIGLLLPHEEEDDEDLLLALDGDEDDFFDDGAEPSLWKGSTLFNGPVDILPPIRTSEPSAYTHDSTSAMDHEPSSSSSSPSTSSTSTTPSSAPSPSTTTSPGLISPYRAPRALPNLPPLKLHEDLSHALGVSPLAVGSTRGARVADAVVRGLPVVVAAGGGAQRPTLRRSTSLPTSVGEMSLSESEPVLEGVRGREREREKDGRRVGSISPIACEA